MLFLHCAVSGTPSPRFSHHFAMETNAYYWQRRMQTAYRLEWLSADSSRKHMHSEFDRQRYGVLMILLKSILWSINFYFWLDQVPAWKTMVDPCSISMVLALALHHGIIVLHDFQISTLNCGQSFLLSVRLHKTIFQTSHKAHNKWRLHVWSILRYLIGQFHLIELHIGLSI